MLSSQDKYIDEIVAWNNKFNLTGLKDREQIKQKLYDDSLNIGKTIDLSGPRKIIDIGCGAGFPGIPLKIEHPNIELTLVDSIAKKISFVKHIIDVLELDHTEAICARAEEFGNDKDHREKYDIAVSRAVAKLDTLSEYCLPFVKVGGLFIAQKGPDVEDEIKASGSAVSKLGGRLREKIPVTSGFIIIIEKIKMTPNGFPRRSGVPSKRPI